MNTSTPIGFILAVLVVWVCVISESPNPKALLDLKGVLLVIGGTVSVAFIIFPISKLLELNRFLIFGVFLKRTAELPTLAKEIVSAAFFRPNEHHLMHLMPTSHPFMSEGLKLLSEGDISEKDLREILTKRSQYFKQSYVNDAKMLATLAKFPSSFGMLGSTVGLIDMMSNLSKGADGIGPAMAIALVTTFWGLVFTYMVFTPLADYAMRLSQEDSLIRQMIVEGLLMVRGGESPQIVLEKLNGYLALDHRLTFNTKTIPDQFLNEAEQKIRILTTEEARKENKQKKAA